MKKLISVLGLGLALTFGGAAIAGDHYGHDGRSGHGERMMKHMFSRLDLTDEQQDAVHAIRDEAHAAMDAYREEAQIDRREMKAQMKALVQAETFDEQAFRAFIQEKQKHKSEMAVIKAKMKNGIWNVLTPEQQTQMTEMMEKRGKRGFGRSHKWRDYDGE